MAELNNKRISQNVSNPEFLSRALKAILGRGIMGLGFGIQLDDHLMNHYESIKTGDYVPKNMANELFNPSDLMVVMKEYHTGDPLPLDGLRNMLRGEPIQDTGRHTHKKYVNGRFLEGGFEIELILAYNPSAPSLYILTPASGDNWDHVKVYNTQPDDIGKELRKILETQNPVDLMRSVDVVPSLSAFVDTSIRLIYLMKRISSPAAINYQEV